MRERRLPSDAESDLLMRDQEADACRCPSCRSVPSLRLVHSIGNGSFRSRGLRDVYRPIAEVNPQIDALVAKAGRVLSERGQG